MKDKYHEIIAGEKEALKARLSTIRRRHNKETFFLLVGYAAVVLCILYFLMPLS